MMNQRLLQRIFFQLTCLFLAVQVLAQHQHHDNCPSCQRMKKEMQEAYRQWGGLKNLNINYNDRSDTVDILHYDIDFSFDNFTTGDVHGACGIRFAPKMNNVGHLTLDLLGLTVDSVLFAGNGLSFQHNDSVLTVNLTAVLNIGDTSDLTVYYHGRPQSDAMWGGFYFQNGYGYNLGVGFASNPHTFGRVWYPCFDNFVERATYTFHINTPTNKPAHCNGYLVSDVTNGSVRTRTWQMDTPIPSYLSCVAAADYSAVHQQTTGILGTIPIELVAVPSDTNNMKNSFAHLPDAIAAFEYWFGPYRWNKVGYSAVPFNSGAMEHATNIAYPRATLNGTTGYETLMAHELSHHWWGDLVTCETAEDMWINEGMARYCEHLFVGHTYGWTRYIKDVKTNHYDVVQNAHLTEGGYRPISGVPHEYTYGDHVYNKGASVAHNLRWYLGDSLFRVGMSAVLDSFGLNNINSYQLRDFLTQRTGINLTDFFNDWVFNGGFSHFEVESTTITPNAAVFNVDVQVQQKRLGAPAFHNNTPIQFTFMDDQWNKIRMTRLISGEYDTESFILPFSPTVVILNEEHRLNQARMDDQINISATGTQALSFVRLQGFNVLTLTDSAWVHIEYHPLAPDAIQNNPHNYIISQRRYWTVNGIWNNNFDAEFRIEPDNTLDSDLLTHGGLDSIMLLYRESPNVEWHEHPDYSKMVIGGFGFVKINSLLKGDYALASGQMGLGLVEEENRNPVKVSQVFPNPTDTQLTVELQLKRPVELTIELFDLNGRLLQSLPAKTYQGKALETLSVESLPAGTYFLRIRDKKGQRLASHQVLVH